MNEEDGKIEEWMYEIAWKGIDIAQAGNNHLETKAKNIVTFTSILIPLIAGLIFTVSLSIGDISKFFLIGALIALLFSIYFSLRTMWLSDVKILGTKKLFNQCNTDDIYEIKFSTAKNIAEWQEYLIKLNEDKANFLTKSYKCFIGSLLLIVSSVILKLIGFFN